MESDPTSVTERIARDYFEAWTKRDTPRTAAALADDFRFTAGDMKIEGREAFLDTGRFPEGATTKMEAEAYQGESGFQMYQASVGDRSVRVVEHLIVRNGAIRSSTFVTDMNAFMGLMAG